MSEERNGLSEERRDGVVVLAPEGARAVAELRGAAEAAIARSAETIVIDLARTPHLRGDEIERLTDVAFLCEAARKGLALAGLSPALARSLAVLGLGELFPYVYANRDEALGKLVGGVIAPPGDPPIEISF